MPELIREPSRVTAAGQPPKLIDEFVGRANTGQDSLSIAHMRSPSGWAEPGQYISVCVPAFAPDTVHRDE